MKIEDRVRQTLHDRAEAVGNDKDLGDWRLLDVRSLETRVGQSRATRGVAAVVALAIFAAAAIFAWNVLRPASPGGEISAFAETGVARVTCGSDGTARVLTPVVRPQSDGVHIEVTSNGSGLLYTQEPGTPGHNWAEDLTTKSGTSDVLLPIPPSRSVLVACFKSEDARNEFGHIQDASSYPLLRVSRFPAWHGSYEPTNPSPGVPALVVSVDAQSGQAEPPKATFSYGGAQSTIPLQGGHGWGFQGANAIGYVLEAKIPAGAPVEVRSNAAVVGMTASPCCPVGDPVDLHTRIGTIGHLPSKPGKYQLVMAATWPEGTAKYTIYVTIVPTGSPASGVQVPDVSGMSLARAKTALDAVGFGIAQVVHMPQSRGGVVVDQNPTAGTAAQLGTGVTLTIGQRHWGTEGPSSGAVIHRSHPHVAQSVTANCPVVRGVATPSQTSGAPGTTVTVSGAIYYRSESGKLVHFPKEDFEVWWNLPKESWTSVANEAEAIAVGHPLMVDRASPGPLMLGDYRPHGSCSLRAQFVVPDVPPGTYPVGIMRATGAGGTTLYGWFDFEVLGSSSPAAAP
ncbi:MAG: PASTA domain-containing protein [Actinomycetota bacterium]|nr:PASTA domain-containing protein [Actinomycetota bacterium]